MRVVVGDSRIGRSIVSARHVRSALNRVQQSSRRDHATPRVAVVAPRQAPRDPVRVATVLVSLAHFCIACSLCGSVVPCTETVNHHVAHVWVAVCSTCTGVVGKKV